MNKFLYLFVLTFLGIFASISIASQEFTQGEARFAQQVLSESGFNPGPIDGIIGKKTRAAINKYQKKHGIPVSGKLDSITMKALREHSEVLSAKQDLETSNSPSLALTSAEPGASSLKETSIVDSAWLALASMDTGNYFRLSLILLFGFAASGLVGWFILTVLGLGLSFLFQNYVGLPWHLSIIIGLSSFYVIPLLVKLIKSSFGSFLVILSICCLPVTLVSHYLFETSWVVSLVDGIGLALLLFFGSVRFLMFVGVVDTDSVTETDSSHTNTVQPNLEHYNSRLQAGSIARAEAPSQASSSPIQSR